MAKVDLKKLGKVIVLMGGKSQEREISLITGKNILNALLRSGVDAYALDVKNDFVDALLRTKPDHAFIALHGAGGEDGSIQGLLEHLNIPYTGSGIAACAITMDKSLTKLLWQSVGIPTLRFKLVTDIEAAIDAMNDFLFPLCVKPLTNGSSLGVSKVTDPEQLLSAYNKAAALSRKVLIEPWIEGREFTVGILGTSALPIIEIRTPRAFYDFEAKYNNNFHNYICPCGLAPEREQYLQELAFQAFEVVGCRGWGRVDLIEDPRGNVWFLEVNTVPGMTEHSLVPTAAKAIGISFDELVMEVLAYTLEREEVIQFMTNWQKQNANVVE
jgi:D-alanine-D-alanine ligase